jgi:hypothetical protein
MECRCGWSWSWNSETAWETRDFKLRETRRRHHFDDRNTKHWKSYSRLKVNPSTWPFASSLSKDFCRNSSLRFMNKGEGQPWSQKVAALKFTDTGERERDPHGSEKPSFPARLNTCTRRHVLLKLAAPSDGKRTNLYYRLPARHLLHRSRQSD